MDTDKMKANQSTKLPSETLHLIIDVYRRCFEAEKQTRSVGKLAEEPVGNLSFRLNDLSIFFTGI